MSDLIRPRQTYLSYPTYKSMQFIAFAKGVPVDDVAEEVLASWIKTNHPDIVAHIKERWDRDKAFKDGLMARLNPKLKEML